MAEYSFLIAKTVDHSGYAVGHITLNRLDMHNAFNPLMIRELTTAFQAVYADSTIKSVVLRANGKAFSAGADLNWMRSMASYTFEENTADALALADLMDTIWHCPKPTIALVQGAAYGGGVGLVAACDFAIGVSKASFCLSEVKLGLLPAVIMPVLIDKLGGATARRLSLSAEQFNANRAKDLGLLSAVVAENSELEKELEDLLCIMALGAPSAQSAVKQLIRNLVPALEPVSTTEKKQISSAHKIVSESIARQRVSSEGQQGMAAFLKKSTAPWVSSSKNN
ncbi:MAG: enoyl-CoA hydratase-related protein [Cyanobacteria bacterium P01_H01_bin.74]